MELNQIQSPIPRINFFYRKWFEGFAAISYVSAFVCVFVQSFGVGAACVF